MKQPTTDELIIDETFQRYCLQPQHPDYTVWANRLAEEPTLVPFASEAKSFILALHDALPTSQAASAKTIFEQNFSAIQPRKRPLWWNYAATASIAILVGAGLFWWKQQPAPTSPIQETVYSSDATHRRVLTLPDGSRVSLHFNTKIKLKSDYNTTARHIELLKGDTFFEVAKDASRPFVVHTQNTETRALGTAFLVETPEAGGVLISLVEGKVRISEQSQSLDLNAGEAARTGKVLRKERILTNRVAMFQSGELTFKDADWQQISSDLADFYGISFKTRHQPKQTKHFSSRFSGKSLEEILQVLSIVQGFEFQRTGSEVIVTFR